ncbi:outer membrane lipoprotein carrier protein LolA [Ascidiimonas aurantiaca]|uniref:LolA family protein n=1 Tax=Ascidiimonas aurantiaca TaxID=1685432 RepID=UPI0030ECFAAE
MKNKKITFLMMMVFAVFAINAQNSAKAKALLDEVYEKVTGYENIVIDFKYSLNNPSENVKQDTRGNVTLKEDKYLLNYLGATVMFDGKKVHTIVPENEEVTIDAQDTDSEGTITPSKMLTFYKEGYKYEWDILQNVKGRKIQYVKLIPIDTNAELKHILLGIDAQTKHIYKLIQTDTSGTQVTITVNSFKTNQPISKTLFTFDENKYIDEGYYITRN